MNTDQVRCMRVFVALGLAWAVWVPAAVNTWAQAPARLADSTLTVTLVDTVVSPYDQFYSLPIYLTTPDVPVAGIQLRFVADRPDLVELPDSATYFPLVDLTGSAIAGWDYVNENALAPVVLNLAGISNLPGGSSPAPLAPSVIPYRIAKFTMRCIAPQSVLDTLQDRSVTWYLVVASCSFSDPAGNLIGIRDTSYCANPPVCDSFYNTTYDANTYVSGTVTIAPSCQGRGDVNSTGTINSSDIIYLVNYVFKGGPLPACNGITGDVECSGTVTSSDIIYLVNYVFKGGLPPC